MKAMLFSLVLLVAVPAQANDLKDLIGGFLKYRLMSEVHQLDENAQHLHHVTHVISGLSRVADRAHDLAEAAEHLHVVVETKASKAHIRRDFRRVQRAMRRLHRTLRRAHGIHHNPHVQRDVRRVRRSFQKVRRLIRIMNYTGFGHWRLLHKAGFEF